MSYSFNFPYTFSLLNTPFQLFLTHLFKFLTHLYLTPLLHLFKPPFDHPNYSKFSVTNPHTNFEKFLTLSSSSSSLLFTKTFPFPFQQNPNRNLHHFSSILCIFFTLFSFLSSSYFYISITTSIQASLTTWERLEHHLPRGLILKNPLKRKKRISASITKPSSSSYHMKKEQSWQP